MKECAINSNIMFPSDDEPSIVAKPGKRPFHFPTSFVTAKFSPIFIFLLFVIFSIGTNQINTAFSQTFPQRIAVISFISNDSLRLLFGPSTPITRHRYILQCLFKELDFARARRVQVVPQRNSLAVDHHHPLRAFAPLGWSDARAPFLAGAKLPSTNASLQSSCSFLSNSDNNARQALNQMSCSSHSLSLRQQVEALPYSLGNSAQGAPVRKIQRIPSNTFRLSALGRPPSLPILPSGNNGAIFPQRSSFNFHRVLLAMVLSTSPWLFLHKAIDDYWLKC